MSSQDNETSSKYTAAGFSHTFTKSCLGRFYEDTSIDGATAKIERQKQMLVKHEESISMQKERVAQEIEKMELARKKVLRKQQREAQRIIAQNQKAAIFIQKHWRAYCARCYTCSIRSAVQITSFIKMIRQRRAFIITRDNARALAIKQKQSAASIRISTAFRRYVNFLKARRLMALKHKSSVKIQASFRGHVGRKLAEENRKNALEKFARYKAAVDIQRAYRGYAVREAVADTIYLITLAQAAFRGYVARKKFIKEREERTAEAAAVVTPVVEEEKTSRVRTKLESAVQAGQQASSEQASSVHTHANCTRCCATPPIANSSSNKDSILKRQSSLPAIKNHSMLKKMDEETKKQKYREWFARKQRDAKLQASKAAMAEVKKKEKAETKLMEREDRASRVIRRLEEQRQSVLESPSVAALLPKKSLVCKQSIVETTSSTSTSRDFAKTATELEQYDAKMKALRLQKLAKQKEQKARDAEILQMDREDRAMRVFEKQQQRLAYQKAKQARIALAAAAKLEQARLDSISIKKPAIPKQLKKKKKRSKKYISNNNNNEEEYDDDDDFYEEEDHFDTIVREDSIALFSAS